MSLRRGSDKAGHDSECQQTGESVHFGTGFSRGVGVVIMSNEDIISLLIELEKDVRYQDFSSETEPEFLYETGKIPILISAPHGAVHTRNGDKEEDEYTAGIARLIGRKTAAHVLYARRKSRTDPNINPDAPYKVTLQQIVHENMIRFVIDLHGAKSNSDFGVAIGTMHGKSCSADDKLLIVNIFRKHAITEEGMSLARLDIDDSFPAEGNNGRETITKYCHRIAIPAAQFEINAHLRIPIRREDATNHDIPFSGKPELIINLVESLSALVSSLAER